VGRSADHGGARILEEEPMLHLTVREPAGAVRRARGDASLIVTALGTHDQPAAVLAAVEEAQAFEPAVAFTVLPGTGYAPPWGAEEVLTVLVVDEPVRTSSFASRLAAALEQDAVLIHELGGGKRRPPAPARDGRPVREGRR
jgi:hypothetical protein